MWHCCQKCILRVKRIFLRFVVSRKTLFATVFGLLAKRFRQGRGKYTLPVQKNDLRKNRFFLENYFSIFLDLSEWVLQLSKFISARLSKLNSPCPEDHLEERNEFENPIFSQSRSDFEIKIYGSVVKSALYVSKRNFCCFLFLKELFLIMFLDFEEEIFGKVRKLYSSCPEERFEEKSFFLE